MNERTRADHDQNYQMKKIGIEGSSSAENLEIVQGDSAGKVREEKMKFREDKEMKGGMRITQKEDEKNGRKMYENSVRMQQEEMEKK